jgi:hypothetical protein
MMNKITQIKHKLSQPSAVEMLLFAGSLFMYLGYLGLEALPEVVGSSLMLLGG